MRGMGMQHPGFKRTKKYDNKTGYKKKGKSCMDHSHMNYTKDKKSGSPSSGDMAGKAASHGNSGERKK